MKKNIIKFFLIIGVFLTFTEVVNAQIISTPMDVPFKASDIINSQAMKNKITSISKDAFNQLTKDDIKTSVERAKPEILRKVY
ncbi:MAG: hypothetical protein LBU68_00355 [Rickettsiales bacterium]|jgi:hypothetical protein|nr:hypothetical protein [Rickettsiales bacterium]